MSKGNNAELAEVAAAETVAQPEPTSAPAPAEVDNVSDELYEAAERELRGESDEPAEIEAAPGTEQPAEVASEQATEPKAPEPVKIASDADYIFVDDDGKEHRIKGSDATWLTQQYHRKLQEKDAEVKKYRPLEDRFQHDRGGLARDILAQADVAERLAAVRDVLTQTGLTDLAQSIEQRMAQNNLRYDPVAAQQSMLEQQRQELQTQQRQFEAQQQLYADISAFEKQLGRGMTAREMGGINNVFGQWIEARKANPSLPRPSIGQAYKLAIDALRFEDAAKPQPQKPIAPAERIQRSAPKATGRLTDDELFAAAMREQNIHV